MGEIAGMFKKAFRRLFGEPHVFCGLPGGLFLMLDSQSAIFALEIHAFQTSK
jgi:hypothetical protein